MGEPEIRWSKLLLAKPYSLGSKRCSLCLAEKTGVEQEKRAYEPMPPQRPHQAVNLLCYLNNLFTPATVGVQPANMLLTSLMMQFRM